MHDVNVENETRIVTILEDLAYSIFECVGVRMYRLSVCEWEVKLQLADAGDFSGAWRIVVTNVTGHTCTVDVSMSQIWCLCGNFLT